MWRKLATARMVCRAGVASFVSFVSVASVASFASLSVMAGPEMAEDLAERTVFLVCEGKFETRMTSPLAGQMASNRYAPPAALYDQFDGALYVTITYTDDGFNEVRFQPFERDQTLLSQRFVPTKGFGTAEHAGDSAKDHTRDHARDHTRDHIVQISATDDEVLLQERRASGEYVQARIDDIPLVDTRMQLQTVDMVLNRFSGKTIITWGDRNVQEIKPRGAIRPTKVSFLDQKQFTAMCRTMKERLF